MGPPHEGLIRRSTSRSQEKTNATHPAIRRLYPDEHHNKQSFRKQSTCGMSQ